MERKYYGVFLTPKMRKLADEMDRIETAAMTRSNNAYFPPYTQEERNQLARLFREYQEERRRPYA